MAYVPDAGSERDLYENLWKVATGESAASAKLQGVAAFHFFSRSGLPQETLRLIWDLSDERKQHFLQRPQFYVAMRLIALAQSNYTVSLMNLMQTRSLPLPLPSPWGCNYLGAAATASTGHPKVEASPMQGMVGAVRSCETNCDETPSPCRPYSGLVAGTAAPAEQDPFAAFAPKPTPNPASGNTDATIGSLGTDEFGDFASASNNTMGSASCENLWGGYTTAPAACSLSTTTADNQMKGDDDIFGEFLDGNTASLAKPKEVASENASYHGSTAGDHQTTLFALSSADERIDEAFGGLSVTDGPCVTEEATVTKLEVGPVTVVDHSNEQQAQPSGDDMCDLEVNDMCDWSLPAQIMCKVSDWFSLVAVDGYVLHKGGSEFFRQSGLPQSDLSRLWELADVDADGRLNEIEFTIGFQIALGVSKKGNAFPKTLPSSLRKLLADTSVTGAPSHMEDKDTFPTHADCHELVATAPDISQSEGSPDEWGDFEGGVVSSSLNTTDVQPLDACASEAADSCSERDAVKQCVSAAGQANKISGTDCNSNDANISTVVDDPFARLDWGSASAASPASILNNGAEANSSFPDLCASNVSAVVSSRALCSSAPSLVPSDDDSLQELLAALLREEKFDVAKVCISHLEAESAIRAQKDLKRLAAEEERFEDAIAIRARVVELEAKLCSPEQISSFRTALRTPPKKHQKLECLMAAITSATGAEGAQLFARVHCPDELIVQRDKIANEVRQCASFRDKGSAFSGALITLQTKVREARRAVNLTLELASKGRLMDHWIGLLGVISHETGVAASLLRLLSQRNASHHSSKVDDSASEVLRSNKLFQYLHAIVMMRNVATCITAVANQALRIGRLSVLCDAIDEAKNRGEEFDTAISTANMCTTSPPATLSKERVVEALRIVTSGDELCAICRIPCAELGLPFVRVNGTVFFTCAVNLWVNKVNARLPITASS